jgi:hypothetical protein
LPATVTTRIDVEAHGGLRIEVADEGGVAFAPRPMPGAHGGWGLRNVDRLADDWGVLAGSTKVWFTIGQPPTEH